MSKAIPPSAVEVHVITGRNPQALQDACYEVLQTVADEARQDGWSVAILHLVPVQEVVLPDGSTGHRVTIVTGIDPHTPPPALPDDEADEHGPLFASDEP